MRGVRLYIVGSRGCSFRNVEPSAVHRRAARTAAAGGTGRTEFPRRSRQCRPRIEAREPAVPPLSAGLEIQSGSAPSRGINSASVAVAVRACSTFWKSWLVRPAAAEPGGMCQQVDDGDVVIRAERSSYAGPGPGRAIGHGRRGAHRLHCHLAGPLELRNVLRNRVGQLQFALFQ